MNNKESLPTRTPSLVVVEGGVKAEGTFGVGRNANTNVGGRLLC